MKTLLSILLFFIIIEINAQNYLVDFVGKEIPVNTVIVENLTTGESLTLNGSDVLNLKGNTRMTGIIDNRLSSGIKIYPNPMINNSTIEVYPPVSGNATISIFDMSGNQIIQLQSYFDNSVQEFRLSGESKGLYVINVRGNNYQLSGKLICNGTLGGKISIEKISGNQVIDEKTLKNESKGTQGIVDMLYLPGDKLKFTATSGEYRTILTDIPDQSKTIIFNLISVTDADKNNYHLVEIGDQTWLEENLKTTKYTNGDLIGTTTPATLNIKEITIPKYQWPSDGNESNVATYGRLYTWYAVTDSRGVCPTGWHVPSDSQWTILTDYLTNNGYGYEGSGEDIGKSMAATSGWVKSKYSYPGTIGNDPTSNNSSGFSALPGGYRYNGGIFNLTGTNGFWWSTTKSYGTSVECLRMITSYSDVGMTSGEKNEGYSVRCIKD